MKVSSRTTAGSHVWLAFLVAAIALCMSFGILAMTSGAASAAPESSSSSSTELIASSTAAEDDIDKAPVEVSTDGVDVSRLPIGDDLLLASDAISSNGETVKANLFAAGNSIDVDSSTIGADAFLAGERINVTKMTSNNNIFLAGNNITVSGTTAKTVFAAGNNLDIATDAIDLNAAGRTIFLKGTYEGNVTVNASNVVVDPYIVVKGALNVTAEQEPTIASTAKIGEYNFKQAEANENINISTDFGTIGSPDWVKALIASLLIMLVLGIVMLIVLRSEVVDATGRLTRNRPVAILITGLLSIILMPVIMVGLLILIVSAPVSVLLFFIGVCASIIATTYTAIALGRTALPRVNKWITSILFIVVFGLIMSLPVVNFIVATLCSIYTYGSIIQGWWVWRRGKDLPTGREDEYGQEEFTVPRGEHFGNAQAASAPASPYTPSGVGQTVDNPIMPDEPRGW